MKQCVRKIGEQQKVNKHNIKHNKHIMINDTHKHSMIEHNKRNNRLYSKTQMSVHHYVEHDMASYNYICSDTQTITINMGKGSHAKQCNKNRNKTSKTLRNTHTIKLDKPTICIQDQQIACTHEDNNCCRWRAMRDAATTFPSVREAKHDIS